jgi:membrane protease YdiL (CAAX protease family)
VSQRQARIDKPATADSAPSHARDRTGYAWCSTRPLHILVFLLPLIVVYEIGSVLFLTNPQTGAMDSIRAERLLRDFFESVGVAGLHLPALVIVAVLLSWQIISNDRWRVRFPTLVLMGFESLAWTLPILVLNNVVGGSLLGGGAGGAAATLAAGGDFSAMSWPQRVSVAIGAGLYEELLFRMVLIAMAHLVAHDLLRIRDYPSRVIAVIVSATAFALYHEAATSDPALFAFYFAAGALFGSVYLWRGFGIVVGAHAAYDLIALLL